MCVLGFYRRVSIRYAKAHPGFFTDIRGRGTIPDEENRNKDVIPFSSAFGPNIDAGREHSQ